MPKKFIGIGIAAVVFCLFVVGFSLIGDSAIAVLDPAGVIATKQRDLIYISTLLMLLIVVPVFGLTIFIAWRYREGNKKAKYTPEWDGSRIAESIWWGFPFIIILILSVITWNSTHELDPRRQLVSEKQPLTIQVVALQWKWLFIYPEQQVATVNYVQFPEDTPVRFIITSDAPMNSFWIPQLGGQIYAMSGMSTELNLMADNPGSFQGSSANISGEGFSGMKFTAKASSDLEFVQWIDQLSRVSDTLTHTSYAALAMPSKNNSAAYYRLATTDLFDYIIMKYMSGGHQSNLMRQGH